MPSAQADPARVVRRTPGSLRPVIYLLIANLAMSLLLTILVFGFKDSVINFQVAHYHVKHDRNPTPEQQFEVARTSAQIGIWSRVAGVSVDHPISGMDSHRTSPAVADPDGNPVSSDSTGGPSVLRQAIRRTEKSDRPAN